ESITFEFGDEVFDAEFENGAYALPKNKEVTFVGSADFENDGSGASYHWDFGDGNQANGETATNTYEETGEYEVTLTVTDEQGCTTAYVFQVDVQEDFISVDTDEYTVEELITDVLIDNECAEISNITYSDASTNGQGFSSIGYFDAGFSDFPINRGIVMATGNAKSTEGPATSTSYGGSWPGDSDLTDLIHEVEGSSFYDSNDATIIEFDFVSFA